MMWSGYMIGAGGDKTARLHPENAFWLDDRALVSGLAGICGYWAIRAYNAEVKTWWQPLSGAIAATGIGAWLLAVSV